MILKTTMKQNKTKQKQKQKKTNSLIPTLSPKAKWLENAEILMDRGNPFVTNLAS